MSGMEKAFELAVVISAVDHFTAPARKMAEQMGLLSKQSAELQKRMANFKTMAVTGGAVTLVGAGLAKGIMSAVESAGKLQTSMMGVKESLGLTNDEYQKMMDLSQTIGIPTIFSSEQVGGIMQAMSTAGLSKKQVMDPEILKQYVNFADVQAQIKHENAADVVSSGINMAHQYQLYSTEQIQPFLNQLNGALLHTHDTAEEFATTYKYISNQARSQGMNAEDTLSTTAWLGRMGFGSGRGGTNFADFLQRSIFHSSGKQADAAMVKAGFVKDGHSVFTDKQGNFVGIPESVKIMQDFAKRFNNNSNVMDPLLHKIFGTQGARIAMMMTSDGASEQYKNVNEQIKGTSSIDQTQDDLNKTWGGQIQQMQTVLKDIQQAFGRSVMPFLLPVVKVFNEILEKVLEFEQHHPKIMAYIATFASIAAAVMLVLGPMMILVGAIGYMSSMSLFKVGFSVLGRSLLGLLGPMGFIISAIYLLYLAWMNNWGGIHEKSQAALSYLKTELPILKQHLIDLAAKLGFLKDGQFQIPSWAKYVAEWIVAKKALDSVGGSALKIMNIFRGFSRAGLLGGIGKAGLSLGEMLFGKTGFSIISTAIKFIGQLGLAVSKFTIQLAINAVRIAASWLVAMGPIGWIIMGVIALVALFVEAWKNDWGHIQEHTRNAIAQLKSMWDGFIKGIEKFGSAMYQIGVNIVDGLKNGISAAWGGLKSVWNGLVDTLPSSIASKLEIHSPSRVMMRMGGYVAQGLALGMTNNTDLIHRASQQLSSAASSDYVGNTFGRIGGGGSTTIHIHPGAIQINGADQRAGDIVDEMFDRLGTHTRQANMSRSMNPNRLAFR